MFRSFALILALAAPAVLGKVAPPDINAKCYNQCLSQTACIQSFPASCECAISNQSRCSKQCNFPVIIQPCGLTPPPPPPPPPPPQDTAACFNKCLSGKMCIQSFPASCHCANSNRSICSKECNHPANLQSCGTIGTHPPLPGNCYNTCIAQTICPSTPHEKCVCENRKPNDCRTKCGLPPLISRVAVRCPSNPPPPGCFNQCIAEKRCSTKPWTSEYDRCMCNYNAATQCGPPCGVMVKLTPCIAPPVVVYKH